MRVMGLLMKLPTTADNYDDCADYDNYDDVDDADGAAHLSGHDTSLALSLVDNPSAGA